MFLSILHPARNPPASSRSSPRPSDKASPDSTAFKPQGAEDPFLTGPSTESEQFTPSTENAMFADSEMGGHGHLPVGKPEEATESHCISPAALQAPDLSRNTSNNPSNRLSPSSHQSWLSPTDNTDNGYSDLSGYTSATLDDQLFLQPDMSFTGALEDFNWDEPQYQNRPVQSMNNDRDNISPTAGGNLGAAAADRQLLSPVLTNTPSPQTMENRVHTEAHGIENGQINSPLSVSSNHDQGRSTRVTQLPTLKTNTCGDTLEVKCPNSAGLPPSPIVKVSSYTRGDSPSREEKMQHRQSLKRSRNGHLAPTQDDSSSDSEEDSGSTSSGHRRTVSVPISALRSEEGTWLANPRTGQRGLDPSSRGNAIVPSPNEMRVRQQREEKNAEVEQWLSISEANSEVEDNGGRRLRSRVGRRLSFKSRRRARSAGDPSMAGRASFTSTLEFDDSAIPGPGAILEVDSGEDDDEEEISETSESTPESPPAQVDVNGYDAESESYFSHLDRPSTESDETVARPAPWYDLPRRRLTRDTKYQPQTSNAAMMRWARQSENVETASLAATVDTNDIESILGPNGRFSKLRIDTDNGKKKSRRESLFKQTIGLLHRSSSNAKRKFSSPMEHHQPSMETLDKYKSNSSMSTTPSPSVLTRRKPSMSKPHPQLNTNNTALTTAGQVAAVGGGGSGPASAVSPKTGSSPWSIRRSRSKSEVPKGLRSHGGLVELMTSMGGPPMPTLASPLPDKVTTPSPTIAADPPVVADGDDDEDFDDEEVVDNKGVVMDLAVGTDLIVPSLDGFRTHVRQLNPRLEPALVERFAKEQTLRYKRLVELKTKHAAAVEQHRCSSKHRCFNQGGTAAYLPPRTSPKDPESTYGHFQVNGPGVPDHALNGLNDGAVVPALFPPGVPLPPVSRLPAEFECSLCFKVKKFHKPSDWTKHVHEDLQPFTCTFPECTEPKSFKRKADWVRHESERHRHLEWWTCNIPDCPHTCYRKDNFVQHLVREHKMPDPKNTSRSRANRNSLAGWDNNSNQDHEHGLEELWRRVDECRHTTQKQPRDEACRFCGNVCTTWKKLTVHMAKHMEQVSMPVLELVKQVKVAGESDTNSIATAQPQGSHLSTPVNAYAGSRPGRGLHSPVNAVSQAPIYNTGGLLTEAFGIPQPPLLSQQLQMQNALGGMPHSGAQMAMGTPSYAESQYTQPYTQSQTAARANSATYPPPFNAIPRQEDMAQQPATTNMPYNLNTTSAAVSGSTTRFVDQQSMFSSPVEHLGYVSYHGGAEHDGMGQQSSAPYANGNIAGYPVSQGEGYIQPGQAQY